MEEIQSYEWKIKFTEETYVTLDIASFIVSRKRETVRQWGNRAGVVRLKRRNLLGTDPTFKGNNKDHRYLYNLLDCCKYALLRDRLDTPVSRNPQPAPGDLTQSRNRKGGKSG